jgi:hypothetical protein
MKSMVILHTHSEAEILPSPVPQLLQIALRASCWTSPECTWLDPVFRSRSSIRQSADHSRLGKFLSFFGIESTEVPRSPYVSRSNL